MMTFSRTFCGSIASLLILCACGDDDVLPPDASADAPVTMGNGIAYDDIFDETCLGPAQCMPSEIKSACACVPLPREEFPTNRVGCNQLSATGETQRNPDDDDCDPGAADTAPNLDCMMPTNFREAGTPQNVTMYGVVDVFAKGGDADDITIEVYLEDNGGLGELIGSSKALIADPCSEDEQEIENGMVKGERQLGFYRLPNVPTETPLVVHATGNPGFWKDIYSFNVVIGNDEVQTEAPTETCASFEEAELMGPRYEYRPRILSSADWQSIPLTATLGQIRDGSGAIAGEVHDCDDVRLEFAQIATNPAPVLATYFNNDPDSPLPQAGRTEGTSLLGLYAALDVKPGLVDISAVGFVGGEKVSLGWYRATVFAESVTTVTLRGIRSYQVE